MIVNIEKIVADYLREDDDVAAFVDRRVVVTSPKDKSKPFIRLTKLDAKDDPQSGVEHLIAYLVQVDCYAGVPTDTTGGQPEAFALAQVTRAALKRMTEESFDECVVHAVHFVSTPRNPDSGPGFEPAREREILTTRIRAYEVPSAVPS